MLGSMNIIYFYNQGEEWEKEYVAGKLGTAGGVSLSFLAGSVQDHPEYRNDDAEMLAVFVNSHIGKDELERFPKLKFIAARSTGYDNIDLAEAVRRGITVSNVPTYGENTVAELAFALLLMVSRKMYDAYKQVEQDGNFSKAGLTGFDLKGKTIGVVGTGHIGAHSVKIAKGFDMEVIAYDPFPKPDLEKELGFKYVSLDELFAASDIITIHVPYLPATHHLIGMGNVGKIKRGCVLINTARGQIVETDALVHGLKDGTFLGAGLDVLEEENYMGDETALLFQEHPNAESLKTVLGNHYLIDHPRVIITPHNAFNTREAITRILDTSLDNIKSFATGTPKNIVAVKK